MTHSSSGPGKSRPTSPAVNPFARALQETGGSQADSIPQGTDLDRLWQENPGLSSQFGQQYGGDAQSDSDQNGADAQQNQQLFDAQRQAEALKQQQTEQERQRLHRMVNPVEQHDVFAAREAQVKKKVDEVRHQLKLLSQEVAAANKEIEITIAGEIVSPGLEGKYHLSFLDRLKEFIMLLRQRIHSAKSWATQMSGKTAKKGPGMVGAHGHRKTKAVWDTMHHERSMGAQGAG